MIYANFLEWVRGPAFEIALVIFIFGISLRLLEILFLGHKPEYAQMRNNGFSGGLRTLLNHFIPNKEGWHHSFLLVISGYIFHLGFFITFFLFAPHILLLKQVLGISWPGLHAPFISLITVVTLIAMLVLLIHRLNHPVQRLLSGSEDYLTWLVTFLPLLTGYMAFHHMMFPYPLMLALHLFSVEILMVVFPFTKLMHAITFVLARWLTGVRAARKGVNI